jgi:OHCU decarboxylase
MALTILEFNALPPAAAEASLRDCCGATRWSKLLVAQRPFPNAEALFLAADKAWQIMDRADILEAFCCHPRIGQKATSGSESHRQWSEGEQSGARIASDDVKARLDLQNRAYFEKFGYIFIVCASGKSADEMLALLEQRLQNDDATELPVAAEQQRLIMRLRLEKLFEDERVSR